MKYIKITKILFLLLVIFHPSISQNLDSLLQISQSQIIEKPAIIATFKGNKVINGHSIESVAKNELQIMFQHRFGPMHQGLYDFIGLDQATMRFGFDYGISKNLSIGIGRSTYQKAIDGFLKYRLLRQTSSNPISATLVASTAINTLRFERENVQNEFENRLNYGFQMLLARKFSTALSMQIMPTMIHRNLVVQAVADNTIFAIGYAIRYKLSKRIAILVEYYGVPFSQLDAGFTRHTIALGLDIDTGGHIFQLHITNAEGMIETQFVAMNNANITNGPKSIRLGFNLNRVFSLSKKNKTSY